ncbi:MAG TPA: formyltetrahydrofolate deformylase [Candidatus Paceibacterota bacterium]|nr:formyltetrahydrofolate deformylase [Verrucomicrobiota bacterium]HRY49806.1 formyltetrahydrofolate deformylase [Candidatus Paceibacterota bacterium]HSA01208.1 formyltetrahydrofolate deformylase [Candidatus Paceibacterota bacterium]
MKQFAIITVIGKDKTGVIARVTNFLFEQKANIEALEEQVTRGQFSMTLQASWRKDSWKPEAIREGLDRLAAELAMEIRLKAIDPQRPQRGAIFVTKESHCLEGLATGFKSGDLKADPVVVLSNRRDLEPLARSYHLPFVCIESPDRAEAEKLALAELEMLEVDFVVLARYMRILSPNFVWRYKNKIINIHPSLLPSFPGAQAYRQAYERGVKIIGVTAHFVTMHLDEGPIIAQDSYKVTPNMTLKEIIAAGQRLETKVLVDAVRLYLSKRLDVYWGIVKQI